MGIRSKVKYYHPNIIRINLYGYRSGVPFYYNNLIEIYPIVQYDEISNRDIGYYKETITLFNQIIFYE